MSALTIKLKIMCDSIYMVWKHSGSGSEAVQQWH